ncbi:polysaccharide lyase 8 family protein, partial [Glycomyces tenuis]
QNTTEDPATTATPGDFATVRDRWREMLLGGDALDLDVPEIRAVVDGIDSAAEQYLEDMDLTADRAFLWPDLDFGPDDDAHSLHVQKSYERLRSLANAYALPAAELHGDAGLLDVVLEGLDWMNEHRYYAGVKQPGNWYNWQIGAPQALLPIALMLFDQITAPRLEKNMAAIDSILPAPEKHGVNLLWTSQIVAQRGALVEDAAKLALARDAIPEALRVVTEGNGIYPDGSLIQHSRHPYTGGYGRAMLNASSRLLPLLVGTPWALGGEARDNIVNFALDGFAPWIRKGAVPGAVRGRGVSRRTSTDHAAGLNGTLSMMWLARSVDDDRARLLRGAVRHTIDDHYGDIFDTTELSSVVEAKRIENDPDIVPLPPEPRCIQYAYMDRSLHIRPGFTFALAMSSNRIYAYESINKENLHGWYTGSGMQYLHNDDAAHYEEKFWPTVDAARLPGTTVPRVSRRDSAGANFRSQYHWAGGVATGTFGVSGMQSQIYSNIDQSAAPTARKSWFMFDDVIVATGAFIRSSNGYPIESIAENRRVLDPGQRFVVDGAEIGADAGTVPVGAGSWAHLAGATPTAGIGYVLAGEAKALRETRTGTWADINKNHNYIDDTPETAEYAAIWFDHGVDPDDASYVYTLLPGATADETAAYAADPDVEVLSNTRQVQAARWGGTLGLNVWERGAPAVDGVACSGPACVLIVKDGDKLTVAVSDPTHRAESATVTIDRTMTRISADDRMTVTDTSPTTIDVDLSGSDGQRIAAEFRIGNRD